MLYGCLNLPNGFRSVFCVPSTVTFVLRFTKSTTAAQSTRSINFGVISIYYYPNILFKYTAAILSKNKKPRQE